MRYMIYRIEGVWARRASAIVAYPFVAVALFVIDILIAIWESGAIRTQRDVFADVRRIWARR